VKGGWTPDVKWAVERYLETRDRKLIAGGYLSYDLTKMRAGLEKAGGRDTGETREFGERVKKAYDDFKGRS
jgi:hypothetical protein